MSHNNTTCRSSSHMAFPSTKKFCVLTFHTTKTETVFRWEFYKKYGKNLSAIHSTHAMVMCHTVHTNLVLMKQVLKRCSKPLLVVPTDPVISHTLLCGEPLQLQLLQHITEDDKHCFCCRMLDRIIDDKIYLTRTSSNEETFHMSSSINEQL